MVRRLIFSFRRYVHFKTGILWLLFLFNLSAQNYDFELNAQINEKDFKKLSMDSLVKSDKNNLFEHKIHRDEEIRTYFWRNRYWFFRKPGDYILGMELYSYDPVEKNIQQFTACRFGYYEHAIELIILFGGKIVITQGCNTKDRDENESKITVVDPEKPLQEREILIRKMSWREKLYIENGLLHIVVQPCKRSFNFLWLIIRPIKEEPKWHYSPIGKKWLYVYDKKFDLVEARELEN